MHTTFLSVLLLLAFQWALGATSLSPSLAAHCDPESASMPWEAECSAVSLLQTGIQRQVRELEGEMAERNARTHTHTKAVHRESTRPRRARTSVPTKHTSLRVYVYQGPEWVKKCNWSTHANSLPEIAMHSALERHHWRTMNAKDADLFFVPAYLSLSSLGRCGDHATNLDSLASYLKDSHYFPRNKGADHLIAAFQFDLIVGHSYFSLATVLKNPSLTNMIVARFENNGRFDAELSIPYGVQRPDLDEAAIPSFDARSRSLFIMGQADCRFAYRERRVALTKLPSAFPDSAIIQTGGPQNCSENLQFNTSTYPPELMIPPLPKCSSLPANARTGCQYSGSTDEEYIDYGIDSKYFLMIHGDSPSSSRLYDAIHLGAIPFIIADNFTQQAMPFPDELPWQQFAVFITQQAFFEDPVTEMQKAMNLVKNNQSMFLERLAEVKLALDWSVGGDCMGTVLLTHIARHHFGQKHLPPGGSSPDCRIASPRSQHAPWVSAFA